MTASMDTRQETLRMGGIIAHLARERRYLDQDDAGIRLDVGVTLFRLCTSASRAAGSSCARHAKS